MGHSLFSSFVIGSLAWYTAALPQPQGSVAPSSTTTDSIVAYTPGASVEHTARIENNNHCVFHYPPDSDAYVLGQCAAVCGTQAADAAAQGHIGSISCISFNQPWTRLDGSGSTMEQPGPGSPRMVSAGNCSCNDPFMDEMAEVFMEALPIIANIGCELIMNSIQAVAEIGALAIPGVGEAIDAGMTASIQAVKLAKYSFDATKDGVDAVQSWLDPCGPSQLPQGLQDVFTVLGSADDKVIPKGGFKPPKGLKKGGGKGN